MNEREHSVAERLDDLLAEFSIAEDDSLEILAEFNQTPHQQIRFRDVRELLDDAIRVGAFDEVAGRKYLQTDWKLKIISLISSSDSEEEQAANQKNESDVRPEFEMPSHLKKEANLHAECHCLYVLKLRKGTTEYKNAFVEAYGRYLMESQWNYVIKKNASATVNETRGSIEISNRVELSDNQTKDRPLILLALVVVAVIALVGLVIFGVSSSGKNRQSSFEKEKGTVSENDNLSSMRKTVPPSFVCKMSNQSVIISTDEKQAVIENETGMSTHPIVSNATNECGRRIWTILDQQSGRLYKLDLRCGTEAEIVWSDKSKTLCY